MLKFLSGDRKNFLNKLEDILGKRNIQDSNNSVVVSRIIKEVKKNKDKAIIKYEKKFSKIKKINNKDLKFSKKEINTIIKKLDKKTKAAIGLDI